MINNSAERNYRGTLCGWLIHFIFAQTNVQSNSQRSFKETNMFKKI